MFLGIHGDTWGWLLIVFMQFINVYYTRRTEKNTNSMKDALVKSTGEASFAAGHDKGRIEGEAAAAILAKGKLEQ